MYGTDFGGEYPPTLATLTPNYLRALPICPSAGTDTYGSTYSTGRVTEQEREVATFRIHCRGENHKVRATPPNYPAYDSVSGLTERP